MLVIGLLFLISCGLYIHSEYNKHEQLIKHRDDYEKIEQKVRTLPLDEGKSDVANMVQELDDYSLLALESSASDMFSHWNEEIEALKEEKPEVFKRYLASHYVDDSDALYVDMLLYNELHAQFQAIEDHEQYIDEMEEYASDSLSVSIFHDDNSFSYRNIHKTLDDFTPLKSIDYKIGVQHGVTSSTQFTPTDIFIVIALFIIIFYLFHYERENGLLRLIYSTKRGKLMTATMKLSVLTMIAFVLTFIFHGAILFIGYKLYGFGDLDRYIQSMPAFKTSAHVLTTGQYLSIYMLLKACATLIIALFISLLFTFIRHPIPVFLLLAATIGISFSLYTWIDPNSVMNSFKYLNFVAYLDVFHFIADYRNINLFGFPISKTLLAYIVGSCFIIGLFILTSLSYTLQWRFPWNISFDKLRTKMSRKQFKWRMFNRIPQHEWYKLLVSGKGWVILVISIGLFIQMLHVTDRNFMVDEAKYTEYINELKGPLTDDKVQFIENELLRFENLGQEEANIQEAYKENDISESEYYEQLIDLNQLTLGQSAFQVVHDQFQYLQMQQETFNENVSFVNRITTDELFQQNKRDTLLAITFLVLVGLVLSTLFTRDYQNGAIHLLRTTKHGRSKLFIHQLIIGYIVTFFLLLVVYVPKYINLYRQYPKLDWAAPIQSIEQFSALPWSVSIFQYVVLLSVLKLIASIFIVHIMKQISIIVQKQTLSLLLHCAIFIVPLLIAYLGFTQVNHYTFNIFFLSSFVLNGANATGLSIVYVSITAILGIFITMMMWKMYVLSTSRKG